VDGGRGGEVIEQEKGGGGGGGGGEVVAFSRIRACPHEFPANNPLRPSMSRLYIRVAVDTLEKPL